MFCSNCGTQNADTSKFCEKCGTALTVAPATATAPAGEVRMRTVDTAPVASVPTASGKSPGLALVLSLVIVGVGQFYNGDAKKGALMLLGAIVGFAISGPLIPAGFWIWSMIDAYQVASGKGKIW